MEEGESEGFQPARRSSARSRSGQLNTKGSSAEDRTPHGRLVKAIETGIKSAQTGEDWLNLWRLWILQVCFPAVMLDRHLQPVWQGQCTVPRPDSSSTQALGSDFQGCLQVHDQQEQEPDSANVHKVWSPTLLMSGFCAVAAPPPLCSCGTFVVLS